MDSGRDAPERFGPESDARVTRCTAPGLKSERYRSAKRRRGAPVSTLPPRPATGPAPRPNTRLRTFRGAPKKDPVYVRLLRWAERARSNGVNRLRFRTNAPAPAGRRWLRYPGVGFGFRSIVHGIVTPHSTQNASSSSTQRRAPHRSHFRGSSFGNRQTILGTPTSVRTYSLPARSERGRAVVGPEVGLAPDRTEGSSARTVGSAPAPCRHRLG